MDIHGSTVTLSHPGLILSPEHPWVNRHVIPSISHPVCRPSMGQNQNSVNPDITVPQSKIRSRSICSSTVSIHEPTMITSTQTSSFPQSIHSPTVISATQTFSAQKADGICYIILQGPRAETDGGSRPASLVFPCEANPDLFRHLSEFVWRYQLPLAQDFTQAMADTS